MMQLLFIYDGCNLALIFPSFLTIYHTYGVSGPILVFFPDPHSKEKENGETCGNLFNIVLHEEDRFRFNFSTV